MAIQIKTKIPGPKSIALMEERKKHVARGPFHTTPIFASRASAALIEDVDGNTLIDLACGIGVTNVGHAAPELTHAIREQAGRMLHTSFNVVPYEAYVRVAEKLAQHYPGNFPKKTLLVNSGAEAVENAVKIARAYTKRPAIVCFEHGYHGRTYMAMTLTSKNKPYRQDFGPFLGDVHRTPFPYVYRWPGGGDDAAKVSAEAFARFADLVNHTVGPQNTAAVIIEPVLGEGGFVPAPREFMMKLREYCTEHGIVLIADEVQTGFGRTGTLFACEQLGVVPDLMTLAKGLAGGMPLAAVTGRAEIMDAPVEGGIGGTYGGNPVACESALAVFRLFEEKNMLAAAKSLGEKLSARLKALQTRYRGVIGDVRGLGPMLGVELVKDTVTREPNRELAAALVKYCYENGVVILTSGTYGNVVRILAPLVISDAELGEALDVVEAGLSKLVKGPVK